MPGPPPPPPTPDPETITSTSAVLTWAAPEDPNGVILSYTVNLVAVGSVLGSSQRRRKRQSMDFEFCVDRLGYMVGRNFFVPGNTTSLTVEEMGKRYCMVSLSR